jgi:hypothetical protein
MMSAVGISVSVRRESGDQVQGQVHQPFRYSPLLNSEDSQEQFPMLWHIDPYGTTVFNRLQTRSLLRELDVLRARDLHEESRHAIDTLTYLCHLTTGKPHRFLWFVGD